jgi:hypothetical protein
MAETKLLVARGQFSNAQGALSFVQVWPLDAILGLFTTPPTDIAPGIEYAAQGYARMSVRRVATMPPDPPPTLFTVDNVTFGPFGPVGVGAGIGWVAAFAPPTDPNAGAFLMHWELDEHKTPLPGDSLMIEAGELVMSLV